MKKKISLLSLAILTVLVLIPTSSFASNETAVNFTDVSSHWASKYIDYLGQNRIISGTSDTKFEPDKDISRAEFSTLIIKSLGLPNSNTVTDQTYFQDVSNQDWYHNYVNEAASIGLLNGYEDGTFRPNDAITREQTAVVIMHALAYSKIGSEVGSDLQTEILNKFSDADQIVWAKNEVASIINARIITGAEEGKFAPKQYLTRAQASVVIVRFLRLLK